MEIAPYLIFNGNCAEAFRFYEKTLGGKIHGMQTYGESPAKEHVPADVHNRVIHVRMTVGNEVLMGSDAPSEKFETPQGISVTITVSTAAEAERIFKALADRGKVTMPFEKTFWSPGFGMAVDRFGIPWMVNTATAD
jgi:PhnB protein